MARIVALLVGLGAFWPAYGLFRQEGQNDLATLVAQAQVVDPDRPPQAAVGSLVTVTGPLQADAPIGDLFLKPGPHLTLERRVEMYAWQEQGGGSDAASRPRYVLDWSGSPSPSEGFDQPRGHENPPRRLANERVTARSVRIGRIGVPRPSWPPERLTPTADQVVDGRLHDGYVYPGGGDPQRPRLGDERIAYWGVPGGRTATAIGLLDRDGRLRPYEDRRTKRYMGEGGVLYDVFAGDRAQAIALLDRTYPAQPNWSRRLEMLGWLFVALISLRFAVRRPRSA